MGNLGWVFGAAAVAWVVLRAWKGRKMKEKMPELLRDGAVVIDVRSPEEFAQAANPNSVNIPLDRISEDSLARFDRATPIVLCCASGARSGMVMSMLLGMGFKKVLNAGSWRNTLG